MLIITTYRSTARKFIFLKSMFTFHGSKSSMYKVYSRINLNCLNKFISKLH